MDKRDYNELIGGLIVDYSGWISEDLDNCIDTIEEDVNERVHEMLEDLPEDGVKIIKAYIDKYLDDNDIITKASTDFYHHVIEQPYWKEGEIIDVMPIILSYAIGNYSVTDRQNKSDMVEYCQQREEIDNNLEMDKMDYVNGIIDGIEKKFNINKIIEIAKNTSRLEKF